MGGQQSNPFREGGNVISDYTVVQRIPELSLTYLVHKATEKQYLLREITFNDLKEFNWTLDNLKLRDKVKSSHLTNLSRIEQRTEDHLCSNFYKIWALWEYPVKALCDQICERALQKRRFDEHDLWSILSSCILGLGTMQRNSLTHECLTTKSILLDNAGNINIADPMATSMQTNYDTVFNNRGVKNIYLSPEQCESIQSEKPIINKNPYRNDVFTLGMIMLECALLERQDECYLDDSSHIQWQKVTSGVNRVAQIYSPELKMMIEIMLTRDIWKRMDWISLEKFVHEKKAEKDTAAVDSNKQETQRYNQMPYNTGQTQKLPSKLSEIPSVPYSERSSNISNGISNVLYAQPNFQSNQTSANNYARQQSVQFVPTPIQTTTYPIAQPAFTTAPIPVYDTRPFQLTYQSSLPPPALYSNPPTAPLFPTTGFKSSSLGPSPNYVSSMPPSSTYDYRPLQLENKAYPINNYPPLNNFSLVSKAPAQYNSVSMEATKFNFPHEPSPRHVESQFTTFKNIENKDSQSMTFNYTSGNTYQFTPSNFQPPTPNTFGQPTSTSQYTCNLPQYQSMTTGNFGQSIRYPPREPPQMQPIPDSQHKQHDPLHYESNKPVYSPLSGGNAHIKHAQSVTYDNLNLKSYSPQVEQYGYQAPRGNQLQTPEVFKQYDRHMQAQTNLDRAEPEYVVQHFKQGSRYEGYKLNDMRHGQGKFFYQDGGLYDGNWKENKMDGCGSLYYQSGKIAYQGNWSNDQFYGKGKLYNETPFELGNNAFDYTNFDNIDEYWVYYEGDFSEDLKNGEGKLTFSNGEFFVGSFKGDTVDGPGKFYCRNGRVIEGVWEDNRLLS